MNTGTLTLTDVSPGFVLAHICPQEYQTCHPCQTQHVFQRRTKPPLAFMEVLGAQITGSGPSKAS